MMLIIRDLGWLVCAAAVFGGSKQKTAETKFFVRRDFTPLFNVSGYRARRVTHVMAPAEKQSKLMAICLEVINLTCRTAHSEDDWLVFGGFFNCTELA